MNRSKINQLAANAGLVGYFAAGTSVATPLPISEEIVKFAELIIHECASINYNSPFEDAEFHAREVLEHFGLF